jgi:phosphatidylserine decarboxylase
MISLLTPLTTNLIWSEGVIILTVVGILASCGLWFNRWFFIAASILFIFGFHFFRNPERIPAQGTTSKTIIAPADGRVVALEAIEHPLYTQKIAIFLSPLDVHVTRMPSEGIVEKIVYKPGSFTLAWVPKSSELNERNEFTIYSPKNETRYEIRQIAGTIARVIRTFVSEGAILERGDRCGMIKFGSRVELLLPPSAIISVQVGDYVYGGHTAIGSWKS